jgi:endonuclease/exonuclease/phosphatase family metal-dependent hydrolase
VCSCAGRLRIDAAANRGDLQHPPRRRGRQEASDLPREKIDQIFVRPGERWRVIEVKVVDEEVASDHRAVMAKLELK